MNASENAIARFLLDGPLAGTGRTHVDPDEPLISSGLLDSVGLLQLAFFVEERFNVKVGDGELIPENFETIRGLSAYIASKAGAG
jgi:acyl carrier protein